MSLPNKLVFLQSHPLAYMVKLNIEMTMANLIATLARHSKSDQEYPWLSTAGNHKEATRHAEAQIWVGRHALQHSHTSKATQGDFNEDLGDLESKGNGIYKRTEIDLKVERNSNDHTTTRITQWNSVEDELPLKHDAGHPEATSCKGIAIVKQQSRNSSSASRDSQAPWQTSVWR
jgi:hypothetical protein